MRVLIFVLFASPLAAQGEWLGPFAEPAREQRYIRLQAGAGYDTNAAHEPHARASTFIEGRVDTDGLWESEPFALDADAHASLRRPLSEPDFSTWGLVARARGEVRGGKAIRYFAGVAAAAGYERRLVYDVFDLPTRQRGLELLGVEGRADFTLHASPIGLSATFWGGHHVFSRRETARSYDPGDSVFPPLPKPALRPLDYTSLGGTFWLQLCFADVVEVGPFFWMEGRYFSEQRPIGAFGLPAGGRMSLLRIEYGSRVQVLAGEHFKFTGGWFVTQGGGGGAGDSDALTFVGWGYRVATDFAVEPVSARAAFEVWWRDSTVGSEFQQSSQYRTELQLEVRGRALSWLEIGANWSLHDWDVDEPDIGYQGWETQLFLAARF